MNDKDQRDLQDAKLLDEAVDKVYSLNDALRAILSDVSGSLDYVKTYAKAALALDMSGEELRVQIIYVRTNLSHWRGPMAKKCKAIIDQFVKDYEEEMKMRG